MGSQLQEPPTTASASKTIYVNGTAYAQLGVIGRGGYSKVYQVQDPAGEVFALKRVTTDSAGELAALEEEVSLLQQLRHHERVIQVVEAEVDRKLGQIRIVMELADTDLGRYLQSEPNLNLAQIRSLWRQMLEAVDVIHRERIIHSDLKPMNFVLVKGALKVIDFGIAKRISNDTTNISRDRATGTLSYMAPEALKLKPGPFKVSRAADVWSLGIILYQMVYQRSPFEHLDMAQKVAVLTDPSTRIDLPQEHRFAGHGEEVRAQLREVLAGCLQRDPRRRATLAELLSHPLLRTEETVSREALGRALALLMQGIARTLAEEADADLKEAAPEAWEPLADELWEQLRRSKSQSHSPTALMPSRAALAPLREEMRRQCGVSFVNPARKPSQLMAVGKENEGPRAQSQSQSQCGGVPRGGDLFYALK